MVTREEVERIARLARLALTDDELDLMTRQLASILTHMDALHAAGTAGDDASAMVDPAPALRPDEPGADPLHAPPSYIAPEWHEGFFTVPRQIEQSGEAS